MRCTVLSAERVGPGVNKLIQGVLVESAFAIECVSTCSGMIDESPQL